MSNVAEANQADTLLPGRDVEPGSSAQSARRVLEALGFQWHPKGIDGAPDFAHHDAKVAVFIRDCTRDGCPVHGTATTVDDDGGRRNGHSESDLRVDRLLTFQRWRVIRACEHDLQHLGWRFH